MRSRALPTVSLRTSSSLALVLLVGLATSAAVAQETGGAANASDVDAAKLREHIRFLASDALGGRDSGYPGLEVAAEYIAEQFRHFDLEPAGDRGTYFHHFSVPQGARFVGRPGVGLTVPGDESLRWEAGGEVEAFGFGERDAQVDAPVVFAGYGIRTERADGGLEYDDYAGVDVAGKVVLLLRYHPRRGRDDDPFGARGNQHAAFVTKLRKAREAGAVGVIFVTPPGKEEWDLRGVAHLASPSQAILPAVFASRDAVDRLFVRVGRDLERIHGEIESEIAPRSFPLEGVRARFRIEQRFLQLRNVVARLPGSDATLAHQSVVVGGHYDHIGRYGNQVARRNIGKVHNGADDNASGTAGVIEAARLLAAGPAPRRSIIFMAFSGEEIGLTGSRAWVEARRTFRAAREVDLRESADVDAAVVAELQAGALLIAGEERAAFSWLPVRTPDGRSGWAQADALEQIGGPEPIQNVVAMLNLDMIGRSDESARVTVFGARTSPDFGELVERLSDREDVNAIVPLLGPIFGGSDHMPFQAKKIPFLFFNTGLHDKYNTPEDDLETLNIDAAARITGFVYALAAAIADRDAPPEFRQPQLVRQGRDRGPRLGVRIDSEHTGPGAKVLDVMADTVAARAGLEDGDTIVAFAGEEIEGFEDLVAAIRARGEGEVKLTVQREDMSVELTAEFPGG